MTRNTPHRRRREKKTDYKQRLKLLKSGKPRLTVRKSLNNTKTQIIVQDEDGDQTILEVSSQELEDFGWNGNLGNLPSAYLTGYLLGFRALEEGIEEAVLDIGLQNSTRGNRIYAAVKGAIEAGLDVPVSDLVLPSDERVRGEHIEQFASEMSKKEKKDHFSKVIDRGLDPEKISEQFENVKSKIEDEFGE